MEEAAVWMGERVLPAAMWRRGSRIERNLLRRMHTSPRRIDSFVGTAAVGVALGVWVWTLDRSSVDLIECC